MYRSGFTDVCGFMAYVGAAEQFSDKMKEIIGPFFCHHFTVVVKCNCKSTVLE